MIKKRLSLEKRLRSIVPRNNGIMKLKLSYAFSLLLSFGYANPLKSSFLSLVVLKIVQLCFLFSKIRSELVNQGSERK